MGWKLFEATDTVPKGRNNQEPGTEVPGRHYQRIEPRKGRHRTTFVPIRPFMGWISKATESRKYG